MVKLISKAYEKLIKYFFIIIFAIYKMDIIKKTKKAFKKARERQQNLSEQEKKRTVNMVINNTKIFQRMKKKG